MTKARDIASATTPNANAALLATFPHRNLIINGDMRIDQRNAGSAVTVNAAAEFYVVDRFNGVGQNTDGVYTLQQSTNAPTGFINSVVATVTTADASVDATQFYFIQQKIEGLNVADLGWGNANAKTVTLSFWTRSSLTGTFGGSVVNSAQDRSYAFTYTISAANTWEQKTVTIAGDTSGTWLTTNGVGLRIRFSLGAGSTYSGSAGSWASADYRGATGQTDIISTNGATFYITGVQLEVGDTATPFEHRSYGNELARCQRYYWAAQKLNQVDGNIGGIAMAYGANSVYWPIIFPTTMRTTPSVASGGTWRTRQNNLYTFTAAFGYQQSGISGVILSQGATGNAAASVFWVEPNDGTAFLNFDAEL